MKTIDVTRDHCPMTYVKAKVALEELAFGDKLDVLVSPGEPLENIPKNAREEGNKILEIREENGNFHVVIEKHGYIHRGCGGHCGDMKGNTLKYLPPPASKVPVLHIGKQNGKLNTGSSVLNRIIGIFRYLFVGKWHCFDI